MSLPVRSMWDPFTSLVRQMDADFDALMRRTFGGETGRVAGFVPAANVTRVGNDIVVELEVPGVDVERDVDVEVSEGRLVVSGRRHEVAEEQEGGVLVREIRSGEFRREFALPEHVTPEQIEADYDRGLLRIRVRDIAKPAIQPRKIEIQHEPTSEQAKTVEGKAEEKKAPRE